ncbi:MAG: hypothetical protein R2806_22480 [Saprospiraceae bacterium]
MRYLHIQFLSECDLVEANVQGREIYYQIRMDRMGKVDRWMHELRTIWNSRFDRLDQYLNELQTNK